MILGRGILWVNTLEFNNRVDPRAKMQVFTTLDKLCNDRDVGLMMREIVNYKKTVHELMGKPSAFSEPSSWEPVDAMFDEISSRTMVLVRRLSRRIQWSFEYQELDHTLDRDIPVKSVTYLLSYLKQLISGSDSPFFNRPIIGDLPPLGLAEALPHRINTA